MMVNQFFMILKKVGIVVMLLYTHGKNSRTLRDVKLVNIVRKKNRVKEINLIFKNLKQLKQQNKVLKILKMFQNIKIFLIMIKKSNKNNQKLNKKRRKYFWQKMVNLDVQIRVVWKNSKMKKRSVNIIKELQYSMIHINIGHVVLIKNVGIGMNLWKSLHVQQENMLKKWYNLINNGYLILKMRHFYSPQILYRNRWVIYMVNGICIIIFYMESTNRFIYKKRFIYW